MAPTAADDGAPVAPGEITALLQRWRRGEQGAFDALTPLVYDELKRLARAVLRPRRDAPTLQPTALVHEVYLRLLGHPPIEVADRHHFYALAAKLLRQVLVDQVRAQRAQKRGGGAHAVDLSQAGLAEAPPEVDLLDLDRALAKLREREPQVEQLVELRFFGGLTIAESATVLDRSEASLARDWTLARAFLFRELRAGSPGPGTVP
jgi:RNA polymerase sigma factor (TIGR02999 family)